MKLPGINIILSCIIIACTAGAVGQSPKIAGLKKAVVSSKTSNEKLFAIFGLCEEWRNLPADTVHALASEAATLAAIAHDEYASWYSRYYLNVSLLKKAAYDSITIACKNAKKWLAEHPGKYEKLAVDFGLLQANVFIRSNQYKEAGSELYELLVKTEKIGDTLAQIKILSNLGWVEMEMQQYRQALDYFHKAFALSDNKSLYWQYGILYSNTASTYNNIGKYDSAFYYVREAIVIARQTQSLSNLCNALNIEADIYLNKRQITEAGKDLDEALAIRRQIGDPFYTISDMAQLALFYAHNNMQQKGIALSMEAIALVDSFHLYAKLPFVYNGLAENYKMLGNYKAYSETLEKLSVIKDSVYLQNKAEALADLQARYDLQKKETTIMRQKVALAKRSNWIAISIAIMALGALSVIMFYYFYSNREAKKMEQMRIHQLETTMKAVNDAEEIQLRRIAAELHDNIGAQISYISSNVNWIIDPPIPLSAEQQAERLNSINETSQNLMRNMRETIWALTTNRIKLDEFADKLKLYIQAAIKFTPQLHFQSTESIEDSLVELQPMQALNLFRIFQEAVNNTIKYAEAKNLRLHVEGKFNQFRIEVADDGIGFEPMAVNGEHYGLVNMRYRAAESNLELSIQSHAGNGTIVAVDALQS